VFAAEPICRLMRQSHECSRVGFTSLRRLSSIPAALVAPDVVLIVERPGGGDGLPAVPVVRDIAPRSTVVLISDQMDAASLDRATAAGVDAVLASSIRSDVLGAVIEEIAAGTIFHPTARALRSEPAWPAASGTLTGRELEILVLVADGASNALIAKRLWVTEQTVKFHLSNVYRKLGVANRTQASHYAHVHGLLAPEPALTIPRAA
jgi:DNA-binding NarL/FixJ family response regulator